MGWHGEEFGGMMSVGMLGIFMLLFWVAVITVVVIVVKALINPLPPTRKDQASALELLKKRYARGEISKEEYEERKRTLFS